MKRVVLLALVLLLESPFTGRADLSGQAGDEYARVLARYGKIHTIAGRGLVDSNGGNDWQDSFEGGPARDAELSEAHNAQADVFGNVYIVDKDSHAVRVVRPDGTIHRVAGTNLPGDGSDELQPGRDCALTLPNGLHVQPDGTCFILDTNNRKIRRLDPDGQIRTVFHDPTLALVGRGLWVSADASLVYYASGAEVRAWTAAEGVRVVAGGFSGALANLTVDPQGRVVVTDRSAHAVFRIESDGSATRIAGNGTTSGGGDGELAVETGLEEVRGVAFAPSGGFFVCTHRGSDVWFIDTDGIAHLFISGVRNSNPAAGEGTLASSTGNKLSELRAINITPGGDLILTQSDESNVRIVENICPPALSLLVIERSGGVVSLSWASDWDGGILDSSPELQDSGWSPVAHSTASSGETRWVKNLSGSDARGFFRLRPAMRWPAP